MLPESVIWKDGLAHDCYEITYSTTAKASVIELEEDGTMYAAGKGSASITVTCTSGSQKKTCKISVTVK